MLVQLDVTGERQNEQKIKRKERSKKEDAQNSKGREETTACGGVMFRLQMDGFQKQKDTVTLNELPRFIEAAVQK